MHLAVVMLLICAGAVCGLFFLQSRLEPVVEQYAVSRVTYLATRIINDVIDAELSEAGGVYDNLVSFEKNENGDISALKTLTKLQSFDFSSNQVAALPEWPEGCALQTIDGSYNALTNIDGLKNMQSLTHVYMDYNLITNIDALKDCYCLVQVNVFGNVIKDVSALRDKDIIVNYDPTAA